MKHPTEVQLLQYLSSDTSVQWIEDHVEDCETCQGKLDGLSDFSVAQPIIPIAITQQPIEFAKTHSRYSVGSQIGRGGMAMVYRCADAILGRDIAVKVIRSELADDLDAVKRFEQEAKICGSLSHPGVVPAHDFGHLQDGRPFIAMKLVEGQTLRRLLDNRKRVSTSGLLRSFLRICETMAYVHRSGIVHRDLKPRNIKIGEFGEAQVMDWGIAGSADISNVAANSKTNAPFRSDLNTGIVGTLGYMPPEQASMESRAVDPRMDVYALGVILYEILSNERLPLTNSNDLTASVNADLKAKGVEEELRLLVVSCLSRNPNDRPANASEISETLVNFSNTQRQRLKESEIQKAKAETRARTERSRRNQIIGFSTALLSMILVGAIFFSQYLIQRNRARVLLLNEVDMHLTTYSRDKVVPNSVLETNGKLKLRVNNMLDGISNESTRQPLKERLEKLEATRQEAQQRLVAIREMEELLAVVDKGRLAYRENCTWENNRFETASRAALPYFDRAFETFGEAERYDPDSILKKLNYLPQQLRESVLVAYDEWVLVTHCSGLTKRATNIREAMPERRDTAVSRLWNQYNPTAKTKPFVQFLRQAESYRDLFAIRLAYVLIKELDASDQAAVQAAIQALNKHRHCLWSEFHMNWEVGLHYSEAEKSMKGKGKTNSRAVWATGYFQKSQASQLTSLSVIDFPNHVHIPSVVLESRIMFDNGLVTSARVLLEQCLENRPADELLTDELNRQKKLTKNSESYE